MDNWQKLAHNQAVLKGKLNTVLFGLGVLMISNLILFAAIAWR